MQHNVFNTSTSGGTLYWSNEPYEIATPSWVQTAEISPWEETVSTSISVDEIVRLSSRMDWLERHVEILTKRLEELGLTDVSDLI